MKKLTASLMVGFVTAASLLFISNASPASAAPYPGTVATSTALGVKKDVVPKGGRNFFTTKVSSVGSGGTPKGSVKFTVTKRNGAVSFAATKSLTDGTAQYKTPKLTSKGKYTVVVKYMPKDGSVWKKSSAEASFSVG